MNVDEKIQAVHHFQWQLQTLYQTHGPELVNSKHLEVADIFSYYRDRNIDGQLQVLLDAARSGIRLATTHEYILIECQMFSDRFFSTFGVQRNITFDNILMLTEINKYCCDNYMRARMNAIINYVKIVPKLHPQRPVSTSRSMPGVKPVKVSVQSGKTGNAGTPITRAHSADKSSDSCKRDTDMYQSSKPFYHLSKVSTNLNADTSRSRAHVHDGSRYKPYTSPYSADQDKPAWGRHTPRSATPTRTSCYTGSCRITEHRQLEQSVANLRESYSESRSHYDQLYARFEKLQELNNALEIEKDAFKKDLTAMNMRIEQISSDNKKQQQITKELEAVKVYNRDLQTRLLQCEKDVKDKERLVKDLVKQKDELKREKTNIVERLQWREINLKDKDDTVKDLKDQCDELERRNNVLQRENRDISDQYVTVKGLQKQIDDLQRDNRKVREEESQAVTELKKQNEELKREKAEMNQRLQQKVRDFEDQCKIVDDLKSKNANKLQRMKTEIKEDQKKTLNQLQDLKEQNEKLQQHKMELSERLTQMDENHATFDNKAKDDHEKWKRMKSEKSELQQRLSQVEGGYENQCTNANDMKKGNNDLTKDNEELKKRNDEVKKQNGDLKKQNDELKKQNDELKKETDMWQRENEKLQKEKTDLTERLQQGERYYKELYYKDFQEGYKDLMQQNEQLFMDAKQLQERLYKREADYASLNSHAKELHEKWRLLKREKSELLERISSEMVQKVGHNEQDLENINRKNRPMKIKEEYVTLCSQHWLNAKMALDDHPQLKKYPDILRQFYLSYFFQVSYNVCHIALDKILDSVVMCLVQPFKHKDSAQRNQNPECSPEIQRAVLEYLRQNPECTTPESPKDFLQRVENQLKKNFKQSGNGLFLSSKSVELLNGLLKVTQDLQGHYENVNAYIGECMKISWKMLVQFPPVTYDIEGVGEPWKGDDRQEVGWGSKSPTEDGHFVLFYLLPGLRHGTQMLEKGKVICGLQI